MLLEVFRSVAELKMFPRVAEWKQREKVSNARMGTMCGFFGSWAEFKGKSLQAAWWKEEYGDRVSNTSRQTLKREYAVQIPE